MRVAEKLLQDPAITRATLVMATPANKEILAEAGLLDEAAGRAGPSDLVIVVEATETDRAESAFASVDAALTAGASPSGPDRAIAPRSIAMGLKAAPEANLAQISVPGPYAGAEALKALKAGLNVFLFSDNVPLEQEKAIKNLAAQRGLLVMGPDCGTAIVGGVPLGFANVVRRGSIGLVGASGTGLQEVSCQIHLQGEGVSHAIGTGGRDVKAEIGGISMLGALDLLATDPETRVIGIVSKPPAPAVMRAVIEHAGRAGKPVVVCFLGGAAIDLPPNVSQARDLFECAALCVGRARGAPAVVTADADAPVPRFASGQRYLRGLFSGGTFCTEAQVALAAVGIACRSNVPLDPAHALARLDRSEGHTMLDLGDDDFTVGKPHPMIDPSLRLARIAQEAADRETAVLLLDIVLGYAGHPDPAGALAAAIAQARDDAAAAGRALPVVAFVCGTEDDPQVRSRQEALLRDAGALLAPSSSHAARLAARLIARVNA
ncbi:MAG: acyl-CoA synthetase FdrA [Burkholderiales bacterium]|nr:acyl-CoA synthetase FdrA [Burkholderiales bacterium]